MRTKIQREQTIDFAVPYDTRVNPKETENIENYQDQAREMSKI